MAQDPLELFDLNEKLGEGSYGAVYKGLHKVSGRIVAVKIIPIDADIDDMMKEIAIQKKCVSDYIVTYYGSYIKDTNLWIVMEYCGGGSATDLMNCCEETFNESEISIICASILLGLEYLHKNHNIHRDLKGGNILLTNDGQAKLADFGVSTSMSNTMSKRKTVIGTPFWMAPEVIQESSYDGKADVWSLGITAIELAEGEPPHANIHPMRAIFMIPSKPPPTLASKDDFTPLFNDFIANCLIKEPDKRPAAKDLLKHAFVKAAAEDLVKKRGKNPILAELVLKSLPKITAWRLQDEKEDEAVKEDPKSIKSEDLANDTMSSTERIASNGTIRKTLKRSSANNSGTVVRSNYATTKFQSTMRKDNGTMVRRGGKGTDTLVGELESGTMKGSAAPTFMKYFKEQERIKAESKKKKVICADSSNSDPINSDMLENIKKQILALESHYKRDANDLKKLYEARRKELEIEVKELEALSKISI